jgi:hypothetical protein
MAVFGDLTTIFIPVVAGDMSFPGAVYGASCVPGAPFPVAEGVHFANITAFETAWYGANGGASGCSYITDGTNTCNTMQPAPIVWGNTFSPGHFQDTIDATAVFFGGDVLLTLQTISAALEAGTIFQSAPLPPPPVDYYYWPLVYQGLQSSLGVNYGQTIYVPESVSCIQGDASQFAVCAPFAVFQIFYGASAPPHQPDFPKSPPNLQIEIPRSGLPYHGQRNMFVPSRRKGDIMS